MSAIRILIADDHPLLREGVAAVLGEQPDLVVVAEATRGAEAVELFRQHRPDITLMDLRMPDMSGIAAITAIRAEFPKARIIVLTSYAGDAHAVAALKAGASAYLLKRSAASELTTAIREVMQGRSYVTPLMTGSLVGNLLDPKVSRSQPLTSRQREVLQLLAEGRSMKEVAAVLNVTPRTVAFHKYEMMKHLGVSSTAELIQYAVKHHIV